MEIASILGFLCIATLVFALGSMATAKPTRGRLERLSGGFAKDGPTIEAVGSMNDDASSRWSALVGRWLGISTTKDAEKNEGVRQRLTEAGYRRSSALLVYTTSRLILATVLPFVALGLSPFWNLDHLQLLTVLAVAVVAGLVIPSHWVDRRRAARQKEIVCGLPDALDLMVVCVEAGLGIQASLSRIAKEFRRSNPILSAEFELVTLETRAGKSTTQALRGLAKRSGVTDVASLVAMLVQTERFGTSLADTLRVQADAMRIARMQRAEEQAGKAPLKMMFPTILIFAATLLVTLGPGMMQLMEFFSKGR